MLFELNYEFVEERLALKALNAAYAVSIDKVYETALAVFAEEDPRFTEPKAVEAVISEVAAVDKECNLAVIAAARAVQERWGKQMSERYLEE